MQQLSKLIVRPSSPISNELVEHRNPFLQLRERREGDRDERVQRLLDERVELLPGGVEEVERCRENGGVDRFAFCGGCCRKDGDE